MKRLIFLLAALLLACPLFAQGKGKGKHKHDQDDQRSQVAVAFHFGDPDRREIERWYQSTPPQSLPPGLAKRGSLPPGLQKHLVKNGTLPPGLQKKISPFPPDLERRLGPPPAGCDRVFLSGRALLIARATQAILDVIQLW